MTKQIWIAVGVVIVIIIGGVWYYRGQLNKPPVAAEPIKLGAIYAETGAGAKFGEISIRGIKDAVAYFEEETGQKVELVVEDSAGEAKTGVSAAQKLFSILRLPQINYLKSNPSTKYLFINLIKYSTISSFASAGLSATQTAVLYNTFVSTFSHLLFLINKKTNSDVTAILLLPFWKG